MKSAVWTTGGRSYSGQVAEGNEAVELMRQIVGSSSQCILLAERVGSFYGADLRVGVYQQAPVSSFYGYGDDRDERDKVHIKVGLGSNSTLGSMTHELLHADLLRLGFPRFDIPDTPANWKRYSSHYLVLNYVQHEVMFPIFVGLGLNSSSFLGTSQSRFRNRAQVVSALNQFGTDEAFWCRQWAFDRQTAQMTGNQTHIKWINEGWWDEVTTRYPAIQVRVDDLDVWLNRREFQESAKFQASFDEFCKISGMAEVQTTSWYQLKPGQARPTRMPL